MLALPILLSALFATTALARELTRCDTPSPPTDTNLQHLHNSYLATNTTDSQYPLTIKTHIHLITTTATKNDYPPSLLTAQMAVLNEKYAPSHIVFTTESIDHTVNDDWATCEHGPCEMVYKQALRKGGYADLNLYFLSDLANGSLYGTTYLPGDAGNETLRVLDGSVVVAGSMLGGDEEYNLGYTAVHEVGHWFGLLHTFGDGSCDGPGDYIPDTPQQQTATSGCPEMSDSCPDLPGLDPIHNFMDYSSDACMIEFTKFQAIRMRVLYEMLRLGR
ncbi:hypothetical protein M409DRAFT_58199 [Zasmidium cellare ATCC 36951]|uniref:Peptidase M43 pregnancy-associated plasma-A domain-containing protein n=1 Tax=Zasmidium cellare ATCC 36951 TaxID=1080233 RepID=A0A6A6C5H2_ZASCE|nr:uncharacterized protein M409DRAFT_58199 [Zasmidium cellare ATCC 36951]KAF2162427.1 hypothetical protein M409DRAFT_58199 [Zasmidium cellare ATCC 36951]